MAHNLIYFITARDSVPRKITGLIDAGLSELSIAKLQPVDKPITPRSYRRYKVLRVLT